MSLRRFSGYGREGFRPINENNNDMGRSYDDNIPLTTVNTRASTTGARKSGEGMTREDTIIEEPEKNGFFKEGGRRRIKKMTSKSRTETETKVTGMGKLYDKIVHFSVVTRYMVYVFPVAAILAVPIILGKTTEWGENARIAGVKLDWFFLWIEVVWLGLWVSKLFVKLLPPLFMFLCGVVSSGTRKYATILRELEIPLSLVAWAATSFATFQVLMIDAPGNTPGDWTRIMKKILAAGLISAGIYLGEKLIIQLISISYHQRSFAVRIQESKRSVYLLGLLYDASRTLFPMYCREFEEEDVLINDSIEALLLSQQRGGRRGHTRNAGSVTPAHLLGEIGRVGDKITGLVGNIASEISGKQVFNPTSAHSIIVEALEKTRSSEALAKRLWMSFVIEGREALYPDDVAEVLGPTRHEEADECFSFLDGDGNGDVSLDEMIMKVVEIGRERKAISSSMHDVGQAIGVFDSVLVSIVFVIVVFIFIAFLNTTFVTTLTTAGTTLLSLSFVFSVTAQEFLGSCIFLFVKHAYDVGDRVDITGSEKEPLLVEQISLLYTVFKRIDNMQTVQVSNIVLNNLWIHNVTRSKNMKEQLEMFISFDTSLEDVQLLRTEMENFVRSPDNSRDFLPDIVLEVTGIGSMDKLQLKIEICHKSNWSNETIRASRRSKFMCALVLALRKIPIYCPGGGISPLGDPGNPSYSVALTDDLAAEARAKAKEAKEAKRLVPSPPTPPVENSPNPNEAAGTDAEKEAAMDLNARRPTSDAARDSESTRGSRDPSLERHADDLKADMLRRKSTRGRRKAGDTIPAIVASNAGAPGLSVTEPSPTRGSQRGYDHDEESEIGYQTERNRAFTTGQAYMAERSENIPTFLPPPNMGPGGGGRGSYLDPGPPPAQGASVLRATTNQSTKQRNVTH